MLTIKTAAQLRTAHHLKSFRAHPVSTGLSLAPVDRRRRAWATLRTAVSELRRQWLDEAWTDHQRSIRNRGDSR